MSGATCLAVSGSIGESSAPPALTDLLTDTTTRTMVSAARPAYLVPRVDPIFGPTVTRISDDPGTTMAGPDGGTWGNLIRIVYPRFQALNADESLLYLTQNEGGGGSGGGTWLDGQTYTPVHRRSHPSGWREGRWHHSDPRQMVYCTSTQLRRLYIGAGSPADNTTALIKDFSGLYSNITFGLFEGEQSRDSDVWPITATDDNDGDAVVAFAYKISTDTVSAKVKPGLYKTYGDGGNQITHDGLHMVIFYDDETFRTYRVSDGALIYTSSAAQQPSHYAVARDNNGDSIVFGSDRSRNGQQVKVNVVTGAVTTLNSNSFAYASSCANWDWNNSDTFGLSDYWPDSDNSNHIHVNELALAMFDASVVARICHIHKGAGNTYDEEPHATLARFSKRMFFKSNWESGSQTPMGVYAVDWSGYKIP